MAAPRGLPSRLASSPCLSLVPSHPACVCVSLVALCLCLSCPSLARLVPSRALSPTSPLRRLPSLYLVSGSLSGSYMHLILPPLATSDHLSGHVAACICHAGLSFSSQMKQRRRRVGPHPRHKAAHATKPIKHTTRSATRRGHGPQPATAARAACFACPPRTTQTASISTASRVPYLQHASRVRLVTCPASSARAASGTSSATRLLPVSLSCPCRCRVCVRVCSESWSASVSSGRRL